MRRGSPLTARHLNVPPTAARWGYRSALRMAGPGRYRIDCIHSERRSPVMIACDGQRCWRVYRDKVTAGPAAPLPRGIAEMLDPSWLLGCRLAGGASVLVGDRRAYRLNVTRGEAGWPLSWPLIFPAAVAVVDAGTGIVLRLTSYIGEQPVRRRELLDTTATAGDFTIDIPPGLPVVEETGPPPRNSAARPRGPDVSTPR